MKDLFWLQISGASGNTTYLGQPHWIYYLIGAIFIVGSIVWLVLSIKWRNSKKEHDHLLDTYSYFKKSWYKNRFMFAFMLTIIFVLCGIFFL